MQHTPERLKSHIKSYDKAKTLFEVDLEQSSEGQPSQKKPALLQAKFPVSSTGKDLQEAIDRQSLVFCPETPLSEMLNLTWWRAGLRSGYPAGLADLGCDSPVP